jgi:hypothetical protein
VRFLGFLAVAGGVVFSGNIGTMGLVFVGDCIFGSFDSGCWMVVFVDLAVDVVLTLRSAGLLSLTGWVGCLLAAWIGRGFWLPVAAVAAAIDRLGGNPPGSPRTPLGR